MADDPKSPKQSDLPSTVKLNGVNWPWMVTQESLDALRASDVWDDDVWVTTYPKAGTYWTVEIVNLILVKGDEDKINRAQEPVPIEFDPVQPGRPEIPSMPSITQYKEMKQWKAPRVIMTHLKEELMPSQIYQGKGKVIYVIRNPKDTTVSYWHFLKSFSPPYHPRCHEWDFFVKEFFTGNIIFGSWFTHVLDFWNKHQHDKNFLFIKYEDMKKDLKGAVIQIADFLGKRLSDEEINRVVEFSSLESMKKRFAPSTTAESAPPKEVTKPSSEEKHPLGAQSIVRKGLVGDWKSHFTVAQSDEVDALYKEKMAGSSLTVEF